jgi:peptidoglycan/xylan/chitin deacetylase (PgdA/CDA1 family)
MPLPPILCYHKIERQRELGVTRLSPRRFARQMERLAAGGWRTLTASQLEACALGKRQPGARECVITFDDGYRGLRDHAFPVLRAQGFTALCSVITDFAGRLNGWDVAYGGRRFAHLAWRDIHRWQDHGIEFVSHTATHPRLTWLPDAAVAREFAASRQALGGSRVISYPFGAAGPRERRLAREEGYTLGLTLATAWEQDALAVPRLPVYCWSLPVPGVGPLRHVEWLAAAAANRCAVGTTIIRSIARSPAAAPDVG